MVMEVAVLLTRWALVREQEREVLIVGRQEVAVSVGRGAQGAQLAGRHRRRVKLGGARLRRALGLHQGSGSRPGGEDRRDVHPQEHGQERKCQAEAEIHDQPLCSCLTRDSMARGRPGLSAWSGAELGPSIHMRMRRSRAARQYETHAGRGFWKHQRRGTQARLR